MGQESQQRPTRKELQTLLDKKGQDALACYACRAALRTLPLLGRKPIKDIWPKRQVEHVYGIVRVHLLFYLKFYGKITITKQQFITAAKSARSAAAYDAAYATAAAAYAYAYAADAAYAYAADAADADAAAYARAAAARAAAADAYVAYAYADAYADAYDADARADLILLLNENSNATLVYQQPLWGSDKSQQINRFEQALLKDLNAMGLNFLATDIENLWQGKPLGPHAKNYLKDISDTELQSADDLRKFIFAEEAVEQNYVVRAILIGPGGAGKTSLSQLLTAGETDGKIDPTIGVNYQNHTPLDLSIHQDKIIDDEHRQMLSSHSQNKLELYLWDFGGQAIFHSLHNAFMHENCVYILVVDSRHEQAPDEWLHQIDAISEKQAKVLVVTNWFDGINCQQNRLGLIRKFPELLGENSFFDFSCQSVNDDGFKLFINQLIASCVDSQRLVFSSTRRAMDLVEARFVDENFIAYDDLEDLLEDEVEGLAAKGVGPLIHKLREFGRYVHIDDDEGYLCVKPEWVVNKTYELLYSDIVRERAGIVTSKEVKTALKQLDAADTTKHVIDFMKTHDVCIGLEKGQYFFPDAATINEPKMLSAILAEPSNMVLAYELAYLPIGLRAELVSELFKHRDVNIDVTTRVWRDGLIVQSSQVNMASDGSIVLEYQPRQQRIQLTLLGDNTITDSLLSIIDERLEQITNRDLIGYPIDKKTISNLVGSEQTGSVPRVVNHIYLDQKEERNVGNTTIKDSHISNAAIGKNAQNQSSNTNSFNQNSTITITPAQKADMAEIITATMQKVIEQGANGEQMALLSQAKTQIDKSDGQLPQSEDEKTNGLLQLVWKGMEKLDSFASMAERSSKYIAPVVGYAMTYLAGV